MQDIKIGDKFKWIGFGKYFLWLMNETYWRKNFKNSTITIMCWSGDSRLGPACEVLVESRNETWYMPIQYIDECCIPIKKTTKRYII